MEFFLREEALDLTAVGVLLNFGFSVFIGLEEIVELIGELFAQFIVIDFFAAYNGLAVVFTDYRVTGLHFECFVELFNSFFDLLIL